jgi:hypothetical protein
MVDDDVVPAVCGLPCLQLGLVESPVIRLSVVERGDGTGACCEDVGSEAVVVELLSMGPRYQSSNVFSGPRYIDPRSSTRTKS